MFKNLFRLSKPRIILDVILVGILAVIVGVMAEALWMPGTSYHGWFGKMTAAEFRIEHHLRTDVQFLSSTIGERNSAPYQALNDAAAFIDRELTKAGYTPSEQQYKLESYVNKNIEAEYLGTERPDEVIIVGAHYDSVLHCPGANDNGSGTAAVLELARLLAKTPTKRTIRFVLFANEEPPYFGGNEMGSFQYVEALKQKKENVLAMLDMETLGYFTDAPKSQTYPSYFTPFYPDRGNFIAFVGNRASRPLTEKCIRTFRATTKFPSEGVAAPEWINGVDWADHKWFWQAGYPAVMITDTAVYRYPHYHTSSDTADKLNYPAFARVVGGLSNVLLDLANAG